MGSQKQWHMLMCLHAPAIVSQSFPHFESCAQTILLFAAILTPPIQSGALPGPGREAVHCWRRQERWTFFLRTTGHEIVPLSQSTRIPALRASPELTFAQEASAVNGISSDQISTLLTRPSESLAENQEAELAALRRPHAEQRKTVETAKLRDAQQRLQGTVTLYDDAATSTSHQPQPRSER